MSRPGQECYIANILFLDEQPEGEVLLISDCTVCYTKQLRDEDLELRSESFWLSFPSKS